MSQLQTGRHGVALPQRLVLFRPSVDWASPPRRIGGICFSESTTEMFISAKKPLKTFTQVSGHCVAKPRGHILLPITEVRQQTPRPDRRQEAEVAPGLP